MNSKEMWLATYLAVLAGGHTTTTAKAMANDTISDPEVMECLEEDK